MNNIAEVILIKLKKKIADSIQPSKISWRWCLSTSGRSLITARSKKKNSGRHVQVKFPKLKKITEKYNHRAFALGDFRPSGLLSKSFFLGAFVRILYKCYQDAAEKLQTFGKREDRRVSWLWFYSKYFALRFTYVLLRFSSFSKSC